MSHKLFTRFVQWMEMHFSEIRFMERKAQTRTVTPPLDQQRSARSHLKVDFFQITPFATTVIYRRLLLKNPTRKPLD